MGCSMGSADGRAHVPEAKSLSLLWLAPVLQIVLEGIGVLLWAPKPQGDALHLVLMGRDADEPASPSPSPFCPGSRPSVFSALLVPFLPPSHFPEPED